MQVYKDVNNIPDYMKPKPLGEGNVAIYKFPAASRIDKFTGKTIYRQSTRIKTKGRIKDWKTNAYYQIGVIDRVEEGANGRDNIVYRLQCVVQNDTLALQGGNMEDEELYEYMELCNENGSNEHRDKSKEPEFIRLDFVKEAKDKLKKNNSLREALVYIGGLNAEDVKLYSAAMGRDEMSDIDLLTAAMEEDAMTNPKAFIKFMEEPEMKDKGLVKYAITYGIIKYDQTEHKIRWNNDQVIAGLDRIDGKSYLDIFIDWTKTNKNGPNQLTLIRKKIKEYIATQEKARQEEVADEVI